MTYKGSKVVQRQNENANRLSLNKVLNYYIIKVGGFGGIVKALLTLLASILLVFEARINVLLFNLLILNTPCLIDCIETKRIPENVASKAFINIRTGVIIALWVSIIFSLITFIIGTEVELAEIGWLGYIVKAFNFFSVSGVVVDYTSKIYVEEEIRKQIDQNNQQ